MRSRTFNYKGDYFDGFRQYLVNNYIRTKEKYIEILYGNNKEHLWNTEPSLFWYLEGIQNSSLVFHFPRASFALTHLSLLFHNGPSQALLFSVEGSNDNSKYDLILTHEREQKNCEELMLDMELENVYSYIKITQIGLNNNGDYNFLIASFDLFGTYIRVLPTCRVRSIAFDISKFFINILLNS